MNVTILGTGYVGLTTAAALAYLGHSVVCVDVDPKKIADLNAGRVPIYEPGLEELIASSRERLTFVTDGAGAISRADVVFIAVGTPPLPDGAPDLSQLQSAARTIGANLGSDYTVVVNKSTVPIGSGNWVEAQIRDNASAERRFTVASNPEFLREGSAIFDTLYTDRIVVGADDPRALEVLRALYAPIIEQSFAPPAYCPRPAGLTGAPFVTTRLSSAELIKYAANAFLAMKISFINEIGELAENVGANVDDVAKGIGLDARIGARFLQAGLGWGGSCFGKDTSALINTAREYGVPMQLVQAARDTNARQRERIVLKLQRELKILNGRTIGMLGLAFKPDTDDLRDAPALDVARKLARRGVRVRAHDPIAMTRARREWAGESIDYCESVEDLARGADALVLVTEWSAYRNLDWSRLAPVMRSPLVVDGRGVLDADALSRFGVRVLHLGR